MSTEPTLITRRYLDRLDAKKVEYTVDSPHRFTFATQDPWRRIMIDTEEVPHTWTNLLNGSHSDRIQASGFVDTFGIARAAGTKRNMKEAFMQTVADRGLTVIDAPDTLHFWTYSAKNEGDRGAWAQVFPGAGFYRTYTGLTPELTLEQLEAISNPKTGTDYVSRSGALNKDWFNKPRGGARKAKPVPKDDPYDFLPDGPVLIEHVKTIQAITYQLRRLPFERALLAEFAVSLRDEDTEGYSTVRIGVKNGAEAYLILQAMPDGRRYPTAVYSPENYERIRSRNHWAQTPGIPVGSKLAPFEGAEVAPAEPEVYVPMQFLATELGHKAGSHFVKVADELGIAVKTTGRTRRLTSVALSEIPVLAARLARATKGIIVTVQEVVDAAAKVADSSYRPVDEVQTPAPPPEDDPDFGKPVQIIQPVAVTTTGPVHVLEPLPTQTATMAHVPETALQQLARNQAEQVRLKRDEDALREAAAVEVRDEIAKVDERIQNTATERENAMRTVTSLNRTMDALVEERARLESLLPDT